MMYCLKTFFRGRADSSNRVTRREWWLTNLGLHLFIVIPYVMVTLVLGIVGVASGGARGTSLALNACGLLGLLSIPLSLALVGLSLAQACRRAHDAGKSGTFGVLMNLLVPFGGIILGCMPGTPGENEYGPDPYGDQDEDDESDDEGEEYSEDYD